MAATISDQQLVVKIDQAAELLDCSRQSIYNLVERGQLRRVRIAGTTSVRIPVADIYKVLGLVEADERVPPHAS